MFNSREIIYQAGYQQIEQLLIAGAGIAVSSTAHDLQCIRAHWRQPGNKAHLYDVDGFLTIVGPQPDGTVQETIWQEVKTRLAFAENSQAAMASHYRTFGASTSVEEQLNWADLTYEVYRQERVRKRDLMAVASMIALRPGAAEFLMHLAGLKQKVALLSYGMKEPITWMLEDHGLHNQIEVIADSLSFDRNGYLLGADPEYPRVVAANKRLHAQEFVILNDIDPETVIAAGDSFTDAGMVRGLPKAVGIFLQHLGLRKKRFAYQAFTREAPANAAVIVNHQHAAFTPAAQFINWIADPDIALNA